MLIVDLQELEVDAADLETNFDEVVECLTRLHVHVLELLSKLFNFRYELGFDLFLFRKLGSCLLLFAFKAGFQHVHILSVSLQLRLLG